MKTASAFLKGRVKPAIFHNRESRGCNVSLVLRNAGEFFHRVVASSRFGSRIYLGMLHHVSRRLSQKAQQRLRNSIDSVKWPEISLPSRVVTLGERTDVRLHPHFHE